MRKTRRNKFGVGLDPVSKLKRTVDGILFDSIREANRYCELKIMRTAGEIKDLELQPVFPLEINGLLIARYKADFRYFDLKRDQQVVEDAKGHRTPVYKLKKKMLKAIYNIDIQEV